MGTADDHERTLTALTASGVIAPTSPLASTANPLWWNGRTPTPPRQLLHKQLVRELYDATPALAHDRQAILLAGPPGAGKSTALGNVLTPEERALYLHLDADHFKTRLLAHDQADGSLEAHSGEFVEENLKPCSAKAFAFLLTRAKNWKAGMPFSVAADLARRPLAYPVSPHPRCQIQCADSMVAPQIAGPWATSRGSGIGQQQVAGSGCIG